MAGYMLVRHKVRSFAEWKLSYDADLPNRIEAGLSARYLLRGAYDPNEIVILFDAPDLDRAKAFAGSENLKETMQRAGVVDRPDIYFLNG
jgi:hypothetical protein